MTIFINYRTDDQPFAAALVDEHFCRVYGEARVFRDCRSMSGGTVFDREILRRLAASEVVLILIGSAWLSLSDGGVRLVDRPDDWVRTEIRDALTYGIEIVPVLLDDAPLPKAADLPDDIADLVRRQYVVVRQKFAADDLRRLEAHVRLLTNTPAEKMPSDQPRPPAGIYFDRNAEIHGDVVQGDKTQYVGNDAIRNVLGNKSQLGGTP